MTAYRYRAAPKLAAAMAEHGLARVLGGWRSRHPAADPRDIVSSRTVIALAARGVLMIEAGGLRAALNPERTDA